jgi:hypothetical protein
MRGSPIVTGLAVICALAGCASSGQTGSSSSGKAPTATPPLRNPAAPDVDTFLKSVDTQMQLQWKDNFVQGLGLDICQWLDGGADVNYVGSQTVPFVTSAGGTTNDAAIVVDDAVLNLCPEDQSAITGH